MLWVELPRQLLDIDASYIDQVINNANYCSARTDYLSQLFELLS